MTTAPWKIDWIIHLVANGVECDEAYRLHLLPTDKLYREGGTA